MQVNEAFLGYESVRHRLPAVSESGQCLHLSNLEDLIDEIDVFLLDAFGVLSAQCPPACLWRQRGQARHR